MAEKSSLKEMKNQYEKLKLKYRLPDFHSLNMIFEVEKTDLYETEFLLRKMRKAVSEKTSEYLRFIEIIMNPNNSPIFFFHLIKKLSGEDMEKLAKIYQDLSQFEIEAILLDLDYSEEKEAEFIKKIYSHFNSDIKKELLEIFRKFSNNKKDDKKEDNKTYFG